MRFTTQLILKTEFGDYKGEKISVTQEQFDNIKELSKTFYNGGFEMALEDGSFVVVPPEVVKNSILIISREEIE